MKSHVADFQIALAFEGKQTEHFPMDIPLNRFAYAANLESARFVIIDPIWRNWAAVAMPEVGNMIAQVEKWPLVYRTDEISIFRNPGME